MGVAASLPRRGARISVLARVGTLPALAFICCASFALRSAAAFRKATPDYFPDEYMYAELGRSIAESGRPLIRGSAASFPALLQPIVTAPAWALGDVADSYRLIQLLGALAMSLAAVPVFYLAVRLGIGTGMALGCAALAVSLPGLLYASSILAEPFAYPLFLTTVLCGTVAVADRSRRAGIAFTLLAGLCAFTRVQFLVLPVCFLVSVLIVGARERSLARELRAQLLPLLVLTIPVALLIASPQRFVGIYGAVLELGPELEPARLARRLGANGLGLMYASGWILVPGACVALAFALIRSRSRAELAFGALTLSTSAVLIVQASIYGDLDRIQERYMFYVAPLLAVAFCLLASRGWPGRRVHALLGTGAIALTVLVPLSGYAASYGKVQSPFLLGLARLEQLLGDPGTASLLVALVAASLIGVAIVVSFRPRAGGPVCLGLAIAFSACAATFAVLFDVRNSEGVREAYLPAERSWVDRSGLRDVVLLRGFGAHTEASAQLFWNRSIEAVAVLPDAVSPDAFVVAKPTIGGDGTLRVDGRPVRRPLLVDDWGALVSLRGARAVGSAPSYTLWSPDGTPRLAQRFEGYYHDGWLAPRGEIALWPSIRSGRLDGALVFTVTPHADLNKPATLRITMPDAKPIRVRVAPGHSRRVELPVCGQGPWRASYGVDRATWFDDRFISFRSTRPRFVRDSAACR